MRAGEGAVARPSAANPRFSRDIVGPARVRYRTAFENKNNWSFREWVEVYKSSTTGWFGAGASEAVSGAFRLLARANLRSFPSLAIVAIVAIGGFLSPAGLGGTGGYNGQC